MKQSCRNMALLFCNQKKASRFIREALIFRGKKRTALLYNYTVGDFDDSVALFCDLKVMCNDNNSVSVILHHKNYHMLLDDNPKMEFNIEKYVSDQRAMHLNLSSRDVLTEFEVNVDATGKEDSPAEATEKEKAKAEADINENAEREIEIGISDSEESE